MADTVPLFYSTANPDCQCVSLLANRTPLTHQRRSHHHDMLCLLCASSLPLLLHDQPALLCERTNTLHIVVWLTIVHDATKLINIHSHVSSHTTPVSFTNDVVSNVDLRCYDLLFCFLYGHRRRLLSCLFHLVWLASACTAPARSCCTPLALYRVSAQTDS